MSCKICNKTNTLNDCEFCNPAGSSRQGLYNLALYLWAQLDQDTECLNLMRPDDCDVGQYDSKNDKLWCKFNWIFQVWHQQGGQGLTCEDIICCVTRKCDYTIDLTGAVYPIVINNYIVDSIERQTGGPSAPLANIAEVATYLSQVLDDPLIPNGELLEIDQSKKVINFVVYTDASPAVFIAPITEENCTGLECKPCLHVMTRADLIALRDSSGLTMGCWYVTFDSGIIGGGFIWMLATRNNELSMDAYHGSPITPNKSYRVIYDIDDNEFDELLDDRGNIFRGASTIASAYSEGMISNPNINNSKFEDLVSLTFTNNPAFTINKSSFVNSTVTIQNCTGLFDNFKLESDSTLDLNTAAVALYLSEISKGSRLTAEPNTTVSFEFCLITRNSNAETRNTVGALSITQTNIQESSSVHLEDGTGRLLIQCSTVECGSNLNKAGSLLRDTTITGMVVSESSSLDLTDSAGTFFDFAIKRQSTVSCIDNDGFYRASIIEGNSALDLISNHNHLVSERNRVSNESTLVISNITSIGAFGNSVDIYSNTIENGSKFAIDNCSGNQTSSFRVNGNHITNSSVFTIQNCSGNIINSANIANNLVTSGGVILVDALDDTDFSNNIAETSGEITGTVITGPITNVESSGSHILNFDTHAGTADNISAIGAFTSNLARAVTFSITNASIMHVSRSPAAASNITDAVAITATTF